MLQNGNDRPHWSECVAADCADEEEEGEQQQQLKDESTTAGAQQGSGIAAAAGLPLKTFLVPAEELDLPALRVSTQQNWSGEEFGCHRQKQKVGKLQQSAKCKGKCL